MLPEDANFEGACADILEHIRPFLGSGPLISHRRGPDEVGLLPALKAGRAGGRTQMFFPPLFLCRHIFTDRYSLPFTAKRQG